MIPESKSFFKATVQSFGLFWDGPLIWYVVNTVSWSMCSISLIEGVNHYLLQNELHFDYNPLSDLN